MEVDNCRYIKSMWLTLSRFDVPLGYAEFVPFQHLNNSCKLEQPREIKSSLSVRVPKGGMAPA
eukprot:m.274381 g.274381  ORF g.274381 m.274381 type:complete len:63 (-) comp54830_c1_seq8:987-1175(-)